MSKPKRYNNHVHLGMSTNVYDTLQFLFEQEKEKFGYDITFPVFIQKILTDYIMQKSNIEIIQNKKEVESDKRYKNKTLYLSIPENKMEQLDKIVEKESKKSGYPLYRSDIIKKIFYDFINKE